jgi:hypothetical protein
MRRVGLIFLAAGLAGFLFASSQHALRPAVEAWETGRWLFVGMAVMGVVFVVLPGPRT